MAILFLKAISIHFGWMLMAFLFSIQKKQIKKDRGREMGYRSDVSITVKNRDFSELIILAKKDCETAFRLIERGSIYRSDKYTTVMWDNVKWYSDDEDVKFLMSCTKGKTMAFIRLGENYDDVESFDNVVSPEDDDIYNRVCVKRFIEVDCGDEIALSDL